MEYPPRDLVTTGKVRPVRTWIKEGERNVRGPQEHQGNLLMWEVEIQYSVKNFEDDETHTSWVRIASATVPEIQRYVAPPFEIHFRDNATKVWPSAVIPAARAGGKL